MDKGKDFSMISPLAASPCAGEGFVGRLGCGSEEYTQLR